MSGAGARPSFTGAALTMAFGLGARSAAQAAMLILLARALGAHGYGLFIAALAICTVFAPFAGLGTWALLVRETARAPERFPAIFGQALATLGFSSIPLALLVSLACWASVPAEFPISACLAVAFAEIVFGPVTDLCGRAFQAFDRIGGMVAITIVPAVLRLLAIAAFMGATTVPDAVDWSHVYLLCGAVAAVVAAVGVVVFLGLPTWSGGNLRRLVHESLPFAVTGGVNRMQAEIEKPLLARMIAPDVAGSYAIATRFLDLVNLPIAALIEATLVPFFRAGARGPAEVARLGRRVFGLIALIATSGGALLVFVAPALPSLLGESFVEAVPLVVWLSAVPLLYGTYLVLGVVLQAGGLQRHAMSALLAGAAAKLVLSLLLIPRYSGAGAVVATYAGLVTMIGFLVIVIRRNLMGRS